MLPTCLTTLSLTALRVLHLHLETVTNYSPQLTNNVFFPGPNSRDLRSQRLGYYYGVTSLGLIPISLDAISITFCDSPFVKGSARFFVCLNIRNSYYSGVSQFPDRLQTSLHMSWWLRIILRIVHFSDNRLVVTIHKNSWYSFFNHRQVHQELTQPFCLNSGCV